MATVRQADYNSTSKLRWVPAQVLSSEVLDELFLNKVAAIRIADFCPQSGAEHALSRLKEREVVEYSNAVGVGKFKDLGMAYFEVETPSLRKKYYEQVVPSLNRLREAFSPYLSPVDKVRLVLDEQWRWGASLLNVGEGSMFVGLTRATRKEILPHEDKLERDDPSLKSKLNYVAQAAFNCYLSVPKVGGALQIWNLSLDTDKYNQLRGSSYGIARSLLPVPDLTLQPQPGELIIFNPRYLHAVSEIESNELRVSVSGFILYQGKEQPLHLWS